LLHPKAKMVLSGVELHTDAQSCPGIGRSKTYQGSPLDTLAKAGAGSPGARFE